MRLLVDHVVLLVEDLATAAQAFEAAGFLVTPETRHSPEMGTANRCIMLDGSYIELLCVATPTPANAGWRDLLAEGAGLRGFAFRSDDIAATAASLEQRGIRAAPPRHFGRATAAGELRFSIIRIERSETPGLQCLYCQHHTRDRLWLPETMAHPNGAARLIELRSPAARVLWPFAADPGEEGVPVLSGPARLTVSGRQAGVHDMRKACGIVLEMVAA